MKTQKCICSRCLMQGDSEPKTLHKDCPGFPEETIEAFPSMFKTLKGQPGYWKPASDVRNIHVT